MTEILLSIIIPTKNREEYLFKVVKNILSIKDNRFELIIQDNSDISTIQTRFEEYGFSKDKRLKYFYSDEILSFVDNFNRGISNSSGEYIIFIGDDDTITPNIVDIAQWALEENIEAITPSLPFVYFWPQKGFETKIETGRLAVSKYNCSIHYYNPQEELKKLLKDGAQNYLSYNLAKAYHGLIKLSALDKIKSITGRYIGGLSPDIYLSVGLSLLVDKVAVIDTPLTVSGICSKSGSAESATGKHTGKLGDAPHFRGHTDYNWAKQIPKFYSVETIWGDSALQAVRDINPIFLKYFKVNTICAYCLGKYPEFRNATYETLLVNLNLSRNSPAFYWHLFVGFLLGPFQNNIRSIYNRILNRIFNHNKIKMYYDISDINKAMEIVENNLIENNVLSNK